MKNKKNFSSLKQNYLAQAALLLCSVLWGASFIFTKDLFNNTPHITALVLITGRMLVATVFFLPFMLLTHRLPLLKGKDLLIFLLLSFLEPFLYNLCEANGVSLVSGSFSAIIIALIPLLVPFAMSLVFRDKLRLSEVLGIVISLVGIAVMIIGPGFVLRVNPRGLLLLSLAVLVAVLYTLLLSRVLNRYHPFVITCYQNLIALFYFVPILVWRDHQALTMISFTPRMIACIVFLGFFCSTIAYVSYNYGMRAVGATKASAYNNLIPVFSLLLALAIGQERFSWIKVVGMLVVVCGLFIAQYQKKGAGALPDAEK